MMLNSIQYKLWVNSDVLIKKNTFEIICRTVASWFSESLSVGLAPLDARAFAGTVDSLRPSDVIWRHSGGSTLAQVIACCLATLGLYLSQCRLSHQIPQSSIPNICLIITYLKRHQNLPGAKDILWVPRPVVEGLFVHSYSQLSKNSFFIHNMKQFILWCSDYNLKSTYWCTISLASIMTPWFGIVCTWWHWLLWGVMVVGHAIITSINVQSCGLRYINRQYYHLIRDHEEAIIKKHLLNYWGNRDMKI